MKKKQKKNADKLPTSVDAIQLDACETLDDWIAALTDLKRTYGGKSTLRADAGANNVSFDLYPKGSKS